MKAAGQLDTATGVGGSASKGYPRLPTMACCCCCCCSACRFRSASLVSQSSSS